MTRENLDFLSKNRSLIRFAEVPELESEQRVGTAGVSALKQWRARCGQVYTVMDPHGVFYRARLSGLGDDWAALVPFFRHPSAVESGISLCVCQAVPEKERFELVLQKLTELGVSRIVPFVSSRSSSIEQRDSGQKKSHRWPEILLRAARQCRRALIPELHGESTFEKVLEESCSAGITFILSEHEHHRGIRDSLSGISSGRVTIIAGPEGGFTVPEVEMAREAGAVPVSLGPRILRTETASIVAAGVVQYESGNLG